jgi:hypothetical protein
MYFLLGIYVIKGEIALLKPCVQWESVRSFVQQIENASERIAQKRPVIIRCGTRHENENEHGVALLVPVKCMYRAMEQAVTLQRSDLAGEWAEDMVERLTTVECHCCEVGAHKMYANKTQMASKAYTASFVRVRNNTATAGSRESQNWTLPSTNFDCSQQLLREPADPRT